jgi:hypothetical protein
MNIANIQFSLLVSHRSFPNPTCNPPRDVVKRVFRSCFDQGPKKYSLASGAFFFEEDCDIRFYAFHFISVN